MNELPMDGWKNLRLTNSADGNLNVLTRLAGVETGYGEIRYAIGPHGEPRLLVPCQSCGARQMYDSTDKLSIKVEKYTLKSGESKYYIDLFSLDRKLDAVFGELVEEIITRIESGIGPRSAVNGTISEFSELLLSTPVENVSKSLIVGLLGELYVLCRLTDHKSSAIDAWMGPYEQRHDFRRSHYAIEVKSSARSDATDVSIHGSDQLLEPPSGNLALIHIRMEQVDSGKINLESLFNRLIAKGADRKQLIRGLAAVGCLDPLDASWNRFSFEIQGVSSYWVKAGFPRITEQEFSTGRIPSGVSNLGYQLDLSAALDFQISEADMDEYMQVMLA